jgi:hypothetical protein
MPELPRTPTVSTDGLNSEKVQRKLANAECTNKKAKLREGVKQLWAEHTARVLAFAEDIDVEPDIISRKIGHLGEGRRVARQSPPTPGTVSSQLWLHGSMSVS